MTVFSTYAIVLLSLLIIIFLLCFTKLTKNKYLFVLLITIALSVLAFFHDPITARSNGDYTDLYRFYKTLDLIKGHPFNNNISIFQEYNNLIIMKILLFLISRTNINGLLPFISSFVFYGIFGMFIIKASEKYNLSSKKMGLIYFLFICLFNFKMVVTNIRCPLGDSIFIFTLYYDVLNKCKKRWAILGYLICCGIHPIFILFTLLRLIALLMNKFTEKIFYILIIISSIFTNILFEFLGKYTNIEIFSYLHMKIDYYYNSWDVKLNDKLIIITAIVQLLVLIYYLIVVKKRITKNSSEEIFYKITLIFTFFTISSYRNFVLFQRCSWLLIFFIIYWFIYISGLDLQRKSKTFKIYEITMFLLVVFSLVSYFFTYQYNVLTF